MNTRQKGMLLANHVADQIVSKGLDPKARADSGSGAGNREKSDISTSLLILGAQAGIECKNQKNINHKDSWRQTKKLETLGCEPVLAYKDFMEPFGETKVIIYLETFLELIKASQASGNKPQSISSAYTDPRKDRELSFAISHLKASASKVLKLID